MSIETTPSNTPDPEWEQLTATLTKDSAAPRVFEFEKRPRPAWMMSGAQLRQWVVYAKDNAIDYAAHHTTHSPYYLGWSVRGYRRLCLKWWQAYHDDYRQQIASAKQMLRAAKGKPADEAKFKALVDVRRNEYKAHRRKHWIRTGICGVIAIAGTATAVTAGSWWVQLLLALAFVVTGACFGRPDEPLMQPIQAPTRTSHLGEETMRRVLVEAGAVPEKRGEEIRGAGIPHQEGPGIAYAVHTPSGIPASVAVGKKQQVAAALGVHSDWLDLSVGSVETLLLIWVASEDPFGVVRRSPLVGHKGALDLWNDGAPILYGKRSNIVRMTLRDLMMLIGGRTRSGKGMLLANLNLAMTKDVRINIRLFDGKASGEHNALAPLLSTFVKKNPERLALFTRAALEDLDRRADFLDERGKSKLTEDLIDEIGGIEVIVIDELATYTAKGTSPFVEEIVENLCQIAAVGAGLGVLLVLATQVPEVDVVRGRLRQNLVARAAMNTESPQASNTILGDGMAGQGFDASLIPLSQRGRCWLDTPDTGTVPARSGLVEDDDRPPIIAEGYELRRVAKRLPGRWRDPIETRLTAWTGVSSAAGGPKGNGRILRVSLLDQLEAVAKATGRDCATNTEVFTALAAADPAKWGQREGETGHGWTIRVGKILKDELDRLGAALEPKKVAGPDGQRTLGYLLTDIADARNVQK